MKAGDKVKDGRGNLGTVLRIAKDGTHGVWRTDDGWVLGFEIPGDLTVINI